MGGVRRGASRVARWSRLRVIGEITLVVSAVSAVCLWYSAAIKQRNAWSCGYAQARADFQPTLKNSEEAKVACESN